MQYNAISFNTKRQSTPNFGPQSKNFFGTIQVTKKITHITAELVPTGITEKRLICFAEKRKTAQKKTNRAKKLILIRGKGAFSFAHPCPVMDRTCFESKTELCCPKKMNFGPKIRFIIWALVFLCRRGLGKPRPELGFDAFGSILLLFVSELHPFS